MVRAVEGSEDGESGALGWSAVNGSIPSHVRRLWRARILTEVCGRRGKRCKKKQERFKQEIGKNIFAMRMVSGTSCPEQCPSSEIVKPWLGKALNNLLWPHSWPYEQVVGVSDLQSSFLTWIILWCYSICSTDCYRNTGLLFFVVRLQAEGQEPAVLGPGSHRSYSPFTIDLHVIRDQSVGSAGARNLWVPALLAPGAGIVQHCC